MIHAEVPTPYRLAQRLQFTFEADPLFLSRSTGLNAVFFRAPSWNAWGEMLPNARYRSTINEACAAMAKELILAMSPRLVVAIGFSALHLLGSRGQPVPTPEGGRVLLREGEVAGIPALAMRHPTPPANAPKNVELKWIGSQILGRFSRLK